MRHIELNNEITQMQDGFYQLHKDKEALEVFMEEARENTVPFNSVAERMEYMKEHDYYYNVLDEYSLEEVEEVYNIAYGENFEFQSYMAASKFYKDYALKTNDQKQYLESYEDRVAIVSLYLGRGDVSKARQFASMIVKQNYQPATPTFLNAGRSRRGEMVSCFLLEMDDSLNSIGFNINTAMQLSKIGGGVALNLSKLRARGEQIKGIDNAASGVVPVMKLLEDSFSYANQLGQRKGAGAVYLNIFHWDIIEFLDTKKINADEKSRIQSLSIGIIVPSKFFELAEKNEPFHVFAPYTVYKEYGKHLDDIDIDEMYDELMSNPKVKKKPLDISARDMLIKIAMIQLESGYPYLMFKSNANNQHPLKAIGTVKMSNLCTEIFQLQETSEINDYGTDDIIRRDINCNLGSLNIVNVMENKEIREAVHAGMEALTAVSDMTIIPNAPTVKKANDELHSVGLGAMNLHGYLAKNKIAYESSEAKEFARTFFMMLNYYSIEKSMEIATEKGETFKDFDKSDYANGTYFEKYETTDYSPVTEKVQQLFEGIHIPTKEDWTSLKEQVQKNGLYNSYRLAIAPTQSISYVQNATSSVMPIVSQIESRTYANATTYYPMPYLSKDTFWYYKSSYDMNQFKLIDLIAEIQEHIDQGISTILYVNSDISTRELARYYIYAHKKGLKSLYYTRTRKLSVEECVACTV
ncbi:class 1b ribonucleoside-diphosphate reductase subunit alpha [Bacillus cereus group sp. MYBK249-1]|nr:class 1b ribonucleoside-diphosphate reductase subunit alpha [Bacillus cereus]MDA2069075.1 class 1b ribonucleoside-diphosphate reductase subunit alpha [Bacillus cereus]MDA2435662.1 class 1b ribonucleoside-diphosphate reductase subunit alpha [Bacillus cereus]MDA2441575.1 class 1b ribonucleoside-diphosphate reductase subunit alpha [Bacillus cereus]MDA2701583.1 class 1b ribonucleoside-diphosphate reductase subunit alpha [Bacillus cereus]MDA2707163.1 class 1b ribonucleoside-diphosphate reductase